VHPASKRGWLVLEATKRFSNLYFSVIIIIWLSLDGALLS
jgi:hypothetical protein